MHHGLPPYPGPGAAPPAPFAPPPALAPPRKRNVPFFHRSALFFRKSRYEWWRPLLELFVLAGSWAVLSFAFTIVAVVVSIAIGNDSWIDEFDELGTTVSGDLFLFASIAVTLPAPFFAAWVTGRSPGAVWSVVGKLRWKLLGQAAAVAAAFYAVAIGAEIAISGMPQGSAMLHESSLPIAAIAALYLLIVPVQCAAEEVAFRGGLGQIFGAWIRSPWLAYLPGIPIFVFAHGYGLAGSIFIAVFAVITSALCHRTAGVEVAIVYHTSNNLLVVYMSLSGISEAAIEGRWGALFLTEPIHWIFSVVLLLLFLRYSPDRNGAELDPPWLVEQKQREAHQRFLAQQYGFGYPAPPAPYAPPGQPPPGMQPPAPYPQPFIPPQHMPPAPYMPPVQNPPSHYIPPQAYPPQAPSPAYIPPPQGQQYASFQQYPPVAEHTKDDIEAPSSGRHAASEPEHTLATEPPSDYEPRHTKPL